MAPVKSIGETMAPGAAAPVKDGPVAEVVFMPPVAPATPLVWVARVVTTATGTEVTPTRPTEGVAPAPVGVAVVKAT